MRVESEEGANNERRTGLGQTFTAMILYISFLDSIPIAWIRRFLDQRQDRALALSSTTLQCVEDSWGRSFGEAGTFVALLHLEGHENG